jgi:hypothetical protein
MAGKHALFASQQMPALLWMTCRTIRALLFGLKNFLL